MRNAILLALIGVIVLSLATIVAAYTLPREVEPPPPAPSISEQLPEASLPPDRTQFPYLLRAYNGKLAVFTNDLVTPDMVFEVYVRTLPEYDKQQLEQGVRVESYEKLTALIEDYIS